MSQHPNRALSVKELEARRKAAGRLFEKGKSAYHIERKFGVSSTTAREWRTRWKAGTLGALPQGRKSLLTDAQKRTLSKNILKGPEAQGYATQLWTLHRITDLIRTTEKVRYKPRSVWHLLHEIGFSSQKPARRAKERNEKGIRDWQENEWPKLLKKGLA